MCEEGEREGAGGEKVPLQRLGEVVDKQRGCTGTRKVVQQRSRYCTPSCLGIEALTLDPVGREFNPLPSACH